MNLPPVDLDIDLWGASVSHSGWVGVGVGGQGVRGVGGQVRGVGGGGGVGWWGGCRFLFGEQPGDPEGGVWTS